MIPILFSTSETAFTSNGLGRLADCTRCEVTEERNGMFEVEFDYPISGKMYEQIGIGALILCTHDDTGDTQPFEIYMRTAPIDGLVTFNARHLSYRLGTIPVAPFTASSVAQALTSFPTNAMVTCPFTFWTDKSSTGSFAVTTPQTIRSVLGGSQGSILDSFGGGEYEWDKWTVKLYQHRGRDTDVTIRYGKNLLDITHTLDAENLYNAIVPYWAEDDEVVYGSVTKGTGVTAATVSITKDFTSDYEDKPTAAQLNAKALTWLDANQPWVPKQNIKVDFVQLWQTEDYKDVAALERVGLCDTVSVIYPELGVTAEGVKVIKVVYDVLRDRYSEMELGEAQTSFADVIQEQTEGLLAYKPSVSMMQAAIAHATELIRGGLGGHLVISTNADGEPEELLIMDTDNKETAVNVWRFNLGGLAHSSNGYDGPFEDVALTADGYINGRIIAAASVNANVMTAGILKDQANKNSWNLDTGDFSLSAETTVDGQTVQTIAEAAAGQVKTEVIAGMPIVNLLPSVYSTEYNVPATRGSGYVNNGITWKVDSLGRVTANGTATADAIFLITTNDLTAAVPMLPVDRTRKYTLQGCPAGGADSTYSLRAVVHNGSATPGSNYGDTGSGVTFTPGERYLYVYIRIMSGTTVSSLTFWPMLSEGDTIKAYQSTHEGSGAMYSSIIQNADSITTEVANRTSADSALSSRITQNAEQIELKVSQSDYTAGNIVGKINASTLTIDQENISLAGKTINLTSENIKITSTSGMNVSENGSIWTGEMKPDKSYASITPDGVLYSRYWLGQGDTPVGQRALLSSGVIYLQKGVASGSWTDPYQYTGPYEWTTVSTYGLAPEPDDAYTLSSWANITHITAGDFATGTATVTGNLTVTGNINGYRTTTMHSATRVLSASAASQTFTFFGSNTGWELMTFRLDTGENLLGDSHFTSLKWTGTSMTVTRDAAASYGGRNVFFAFIKPV